MKAALQNLRDGIAAEWCSLTHGGGWVMRDPLGRINWQCQKCGRWSDPVPLTEEAAATQAAIRAAAIMGESRADQA